MPGRPKGIPKTGGRGKGSVNEVTKAVKQIYVDILEKEQKHWPKILEQLRKDDPYKYMMVMDKLAQKVVANKKDITSDDKSIIPNVTITENRDQSKQETD